MAEYVNVAVDAMGGDNAPAEIVKGAVEAVNADKRVKVFLVGKEPVVREELKAYSYDAEQLEAIREAMEKEIDLSSCTGIDLKGFRGISLKYSTPYDSKKY